MIAKRILSMVLLIIMVIALLELTGDINAQPPVIWGSPTRLTYTNSSEGNPSVIETSDGEIWVFYQSNRNGHMDVYYSIYDGTWSPEFRLTTNSAEDAAPNAAQADDGKIWVVFASDRNSNTDVYYKYYDPLAGVWSAEFRLTTDSGWDWHPNILKTDDGRIWVFYNHANDIYYQIYDGSSWSSQVRLTTNPKDDYLGQRIMQSSDGKICVGYTEVQSNDDWEVAYKVYDGGSWSSVYRLTYNLGKDANPSFAEMSDGTIWVAWKSIRNGNPLDIYYAVYDGSWSQSYRLTTDPSTDANPAMLQASDEKIWIFWPTNRDGNYEIYYMGGSLTSPPVADAGPDKIVYIEDLVQFDGSASYDPDGTIVTYEWDFDANDGLWWETGALPDSVDPTPTHTYFNYGIFTATLRVTDNDGFSGIDTCKITVLVPSPPSPLLYINISQDGKDVILNWDLPITLGIDHYLIYRSTSQIGFDFNKVWVNTSEDKEPGEPDPIPLRTTWNDTNAAFPGNVTNYEEQYYYIIRAVNVLGDVSRTSRTVGKWTKTFPQGVSTFSLPLEPLQTMWTDNFAADMGANYVKYMDTATHTWLEDNIQMGGSKGFEVNFPTTTNYTFTGMPGSHIFYKEGFGFDATTRANLTATVDASGSVTQYGLLP